MTNNDTIAAIATATGYGGVGIVRLSGSNAIAIARAVTDSQLPKPRFAHLCDFIGEYGELVDQGLLIYFPGPSSFTGEDVIEFHGHGGPVVMNMLLQRCLQLGARQARAGEFSERAFLNDKMDLAQAEAIADLIESSSEQAARAAMRSLQGVFSERVHALTEQLIHTRMYIESAIDFPEEEIDFIADTQIQQQLDKLLENLQALLASAQQGHLLQHGMTVVIAGRPNAGKSSLMNKLAQTDRSIVTDIPGTTRDIVRETIQLDGMPVHLIDTAGLRRSEDRVEQIGVERAWAQISSADMLILMIDINDQDEQQDAMIESQLPAGLPVTRVYNKIDLADHSAAIEQPDKQTAIYLSTRTGEGLELLREHIKTRSGFHTAEAGDFSARTRHLQALKDAETRIHAARMQIQSSKAGELAAEELRLAQQLLAEITGEFSSDDLLGRIFSNFCIGK